MANASLKPEIQFADLLRLIARLRGPDGCPWDRAQTLESMRACLLEECWEVIDTINRRDLTHLCEELGDLLLNILLLCDIANNEYIPPAENLSDSSSAIIPESTAISFINRMLAGLSDKLIRRHPHVFHRASATNKEEALAHWEKVKESENPNKTNDNNDLATESRILSRINQNQPALLYALKLQKQAAKSGFDWPLETAEKNITEKIWEELDELSQVKKVQQKSLETEEENLPESEQLEEELGDLLFSVVNLARLYQLNPELALTRSSTKFRNRFTWIESQLQQQHSFAELTCNEQERLWQQAKSQCNSQNS